MDSVCEATDIPYSIRCGRQWEMRRVRFKKDEARIALTCNSEQQTNHRHQCHVMNPHSL
jgi:hypothetical protein